MARFLLGAACSAVTVIVGLLLTGTAVILFVRSGPVATAHIATEGYQAALNTASYVLNAVPAGLAAYWHVRLTPDRLMGPVWAVVCAVALVLTVNAVVGGVSVAGAPEASSLVWLLLLATLGAFLGSLLAARRPRRL
jgi:hypothetical protein